MRHIYFTHDFYPNDSIQTFQIGDIICNAVCNDGLAAVRGERKTDIFFGFRDIFSAFQDGAEGSDGIKN